MTYIQKYGIIKYSERRILVEEKNDVKQQEHQKTELEKEIEQARKEGKSEAWIRMNLDI